jgi:kinesin family member C1
LHDLTNSSFFEQGALLKETQAINSSLSVLSNVIERLQAGDKHIPFRESKITLLLKNSLCGNSKTLAIVCCNPSPTHYEESLRSLQFGEKISRVQLKAVANTTR